MTVGWYGVQLAWLGCVYANCYVRIAKDIGGRMICGCGITVVVGPIIKDRQGQGNFYSS